MGNPSELALFSTKGIEYVLVIFFAALFIGFWIFMNRKGKGVDKLKDKVAIVPEELFRRAMNYLYHQGHTWARIVTGKQVLVGIDDFAVKFLGRPDKIRLPEQGSTVQQGEPAIYLAYGDREVGLLAPIDGKVTAVNRAIYNDPDKLVRDPYENGWLLEVAPTRLVANISGLLWGKLAGQWFRQNSKAVNDWVSGELGNVLQDGGEIEAGFGRKLAKDDLNQVMRDYFMTNIDR